MPIIKLPTTEDFYTSGKELLDFSWDVVANLLIDIDEAEYYGVEPQEISDGYWAAARRRLTTALSITQQGVEFILKGRVTEISPYLLISDSPLKWPSPYSGNEINFSDFRTIDSQDLIRVIDTFSLVAMSPEFVHKFHELRDKRNKIMHSVDKQLTVNVTEVVDSLLFMHKTLFPNDCWASERLRFLDESPQAELGANEFSRNNVCWETSLVIDLLKPAQVKLYFGINKNQRRYYCPTCKWEANTDVDFEFKLAVLKPKGATSTELYCPICDMTYTVSREDCETGECPGNVISTDGECLTCGG